MRVLVFGAARDIAGSSVVEIDVAGTADVSQLKESLLRQYPALRTLTRFAIAVNGVYATDDTALSASDEVAIIPPVSGG